MVKDTVRFHVPNHGPTIIIRVPVLVARHRLPPLLFVGLISLFYTMYLVLFEGVRVCTFISVKNLATYACTLIHCYLGF